MADAANASPSPTMRLPRTNKRHSAGVAYAQATWTGKSGEFAIKVQGGFVTLSGEVDWHYQRSDAEYAVRKLEGIKSISNEIKVKPRVQASDVKQRIENALKRNAEWEASSIKVSVVNGRVTLDGKVKALYERDLAERTAWSAPGVISVEDHISIV